MTAPWALPCAREWVRARNERRNDGSLGDLSGGAGRRVEVVSGADGRSPLDALAPHALFGGKRSDLGEGLLDGFAMDLEVVARLKVEPESVAGSKEP